MNHPLGQVALALSGGAALGFGHIGALRALEEQGIKPAWLAGTSAGALIGALYARGLSISAIEAIACQIDRKKTIHLLSPFIPRGGLADARNLVTFLNEILGENTCIEDLQIPFIAVSVDFQTGDTLYLNKGNLVDAIRASISIPGFFKPVEANGTFLVDGGLRENLPLCILREFNPDTLIGVNVLKIKQLRFDGYFTGIDSGQTIDRSETDHFFERVTSALMPNRRTPTKDLPNIPYSSIHSLMILMTELANKEIRLADPDLVIQLDLSFMKLWEFWRAREAIEAAYEDARFQIIDYLKRRRTNKNYLSLR